MLRRPPSRPHTNRTRRKSRPGTDAADRRREQHRLAEARRRARVRQHVKLYQIRAGEIIHEALQARSLDAGMTPEAAERATRNRAKVTRDLNEIMLQWARTYLAQRGKT